MVSNAKQSSAIGRVLAGRYRVEGVLGRGAMGSVYRAVDEENGRVCAIKLMHQFATLDERAYLRFIHEAQIVAQLFHPNIVEVWGFDRDEDGTPILAMELLEGQDLHNLLSEKSRLPLPRVLEIVRAVGTALHAAHSAGVLHRDIKPKNIFLSIQKNSRGEEVEVVKVVDFGLSKVLGMHHANETAPGTILGTAEYVAPESTLGMPELIDFRADQWALGVVAYRLISGRLPFEAPDVIALLLAIRQGQPKPLRELIKNLPERIPEHILAAVERAMAKNKEHRFATIQDFLRALDGLPAVGDLLTKSSDGVPAINSPEWSKRNLGSASLSDLGRISISGATPAPPSSNSTSGRLHPPSSNSTSGRLHPPSSTSGRIRDSATSGRLSPRSTAVGLGPVALDPNSSDAGDSGGSQTPSRRTPKYGLIGSQVSSSAELASALASGAAVPPEAAQTAPQTGKGSEPSAEYSMHVSGHLVKGHGASPNAAAGRPPGRPLGSRLGFILLAGGLALAVFGLVLAPMLRRPAKPTPETAAPRLLPQPSTTASPPDKASAPAPVAPTPPAIPSVASPTGVSGAEAGASPPLAPPAPAVPSLSARAVAPPAPQPKSVDSGAAQGAANRGSHMNSGARGGRPGQGQAWNAAASSAGRHASPGTGGAGKSPAPPRDKPATQAESRPADAASKAAGAPSPAAPPPKDADPPKRITVVD